MKLSDYAEADRRADPAERALEWVATIPDRGPLGRAALFGAAALYWACAAASAARLILHAI